MNKENHFMEQIQKSFEVFHNATDEDKKRVHREIKEKYFIFDRIMDKDYSGWKEVIKITGITSYGQSVESEFYFNSENYHSNNLSEYSELTDDKIRETIEKLIKLEKENRNNNATEVAE